ncbi:MAG: helix-turn-helix domain-containing protein, partial [Oscillospiraceae bacterium]
MNQEKIGAFIAALRKEKGYTQREIADRLELSEKTVSKWECGKGLPDVVYMEPLCSLLGISVNELLAGERIPIIDLLRRMDETRLELVTQLEFEQLKLRV